MERAGRRPERNWEHQHAALPAFRGDEHVAQHDPLALAKWQYRRYAEHHGRPPVPTGRIVLEPSSNKKGKEHRPERSGESWTDRERVFLVKGVLQGETLSALVLVHRRSEGALRSELKRIGQSLQAVAAR
jgi:hypothetical protein